jgi:hypothetical protein
MAAPSMPQITSGSGRASDHQMKNTTVSNKVPTTAKNSRKPMQSAPHCPAKLRDIIIFDREWPNESNTLVIDDQGQLYLGNGDEGTDWSGRDPSKLKPVSAIQAADWYCRLEGEVRGVTGNVAELLEILAAMIKTADVWAPKRLALNAAEAQEILGLNDGRSEQAKKAAFYRFCQQHDIRPFPGRVFSLKDIESALSN